VNSDTPRQEVTVTNIKMPFRSMVLFMVKWAIASIPAMLILVALGAIVWGLLLASFRFHPKPVPSRSGNATDSRTSASTSTSAASDPEQAAYLSKVLVRNVSVSKSDLGEAGVFGETKNTGDRTLKEVEITIYCLGSDGKPVFEKTYHPVLVSGLSFGDSNLPLKPGYSRQFGVKMDDAPSDWSKKVDVKVTAVQFQ
jgi:hypothetical protein